MKTMKRLPFVGASAIRVTEYGVRVAMVSAIAVMTAVSCSGNAGRGPAIAHAGNRLTVRIPLRELFRRSDAAAPGQGALNGSAPLVAGTTASGTRGDGNASSPSSPASSDGSITVHIDLTAPWTPTPIEVHQGDQISISASGKMNWFTGQNKCSGRPCISTPDGTSCPFPGFTAQGLPCWSLIGIILPGGAPFFVGSANSFTAPSSGQLFLGVNDNNHPDNTGSWSARVHVVRDETQFAQDDSKPIIGQHTKREIERRKRKEGESDSSPKEEKPLPPMTR